MQSKTKICKFILHGLDCPQGEEACQFSHQAPDITVHGGKSPVKKSAGRGKSRPPRANFQPRDSVVEEEKVRSPHRNQKSNKLFQEVQIYKSLPQRSPETAAVARGGSQASQIQFRGGKRGGQIGGYHQRIGQDATEGGLMSRGGSSAGAFRGGMGVTVGAEASGSSADHKTGGQHARRDQKDKGRVTNAAEIFDSKSTRGRGRRIDQTIKGRGQTDLNKRGRGRGRERDQDHQRQGSNTLGLNHNHKQNLDQGELKNLLSQEENRSNSSKFKTQDKGKVQGILQSFVRIVVSDQNIEENFYESVLKDGCNLAIDDLTLRRIILKFISLLITKKIEIDREALLVALNQNFFDMNSLEMYRKQVSGRISNLQSPQIIDQIIEDLLQWTQGCQRVLFCFKSRYLQVPAEQLKMLASNFENDVQAVMKQAFSEKEKKLGLNFQSLMKELDTLYHHWKNLYKEDPNQIRDQPQLNQVARRIVEELRPSDDFRKLNINPTIQELTNYKFQPFLRKIHQNKGFEDLDDYLDRNFRLLKEDFSCDLREGLRSFKQNPDQRNMLVSIYPNSRISGFYATKYFFGLRLQIFQEKRKGGFQQSWQQSQRLMLGNMIIFSDDSFQQNIVIGVIKNRDGKQMDYTLQKYGFIEIDIEIINDHFDPFQTFRQMSNRRIVILESKSYFEAFYHILDQLQQIRELPFEELIVYTNPQAIFEPAYLQRMNTIALVESKMTQFTLDQYQRKAFKNAFTKNVSLIQGPPGTGKTFIGEKIAQLMLEMLQKDKNGEGGLSTGPIFLTCFTNHALDQFLEKISEYTKNIVRLGGGTKNELLKQFTLGQVRKNKGIRNSREYGVKMKDQQRLVEDCLKLTNYYEQAKFVQTIDQKMIRDFQYQLEDKMQREQVERLIQIIEDVQFNYLAKTKQFLGRQTQEFAQYYKDNVSDQIPVAAMFEWLGILDLDFVLAQFNQMK